MMMRVRPNPIHKRILVEIEKEVQIHPHYADLQNQLALLLMARGEMKKAKSHFLKALHLSPKYRGAIFNLGALYEDQKNGEGREGNIEKFSR